ncbi:hypothetical protein IEQ34_003141 [Dendrobium chrysotoxum]|uniref:Uncharacterized protein n=1 Tax=Dendrobium chrysotoxum TaxID=161865 RepID=A0AAV7HKV6_DENCH|nr:hypothetical protein IEQ34_003141 [Dendrobium chrysotoxum]
MTSTNRAQQVRQMTRTATSHQKLSPPSQGKLALILSDDIFELALPFSLSLIYKFSWGHPSMMSFHIFMVDLHWLGYSIGLIDYCHVLIK